MLRGITEFAKLHMSLVVLVKIMSVLINFLLQNTNLVSVLSNFAQILLVISDRSDNFAKSGIMVFNATFNNISVISWRSVLLVEEPGGPGENHRPVESHWQIYHIMVYRVHLPINRIQTQNLSSDRNQLHRYHTTTTAPKYC